MRFLMRRVGVLEPNGARVLSYLLFERGYCRRLMHLGFTDAMPADQVDISREETLHQPAADCSTIVDS
jgi:hypothetical protein